MSAFPSYLATVHPLFLLLGLPVVAALLFAVLPSYRLAARLNVVLTGLTLLFSVCLFTAPRMIWPLLFVDDLNIYLIVLTSFVSFTTSLFSAFYILREVAHRRLRARFVRFYHAMYQSFVFTMLLALSSNNLGVLWVAVEGATLATVMMIGLYRTPASIEAAWKYFILCGVGIALALFGTILLYFAAAPVMGPGLPAMTWTELLPRMAELNPTILNLAFVFLLVGYGTKVGLAPLHYWLPDAHSEGPTPISAVLSGLLLNVALYAVLRFKMLMSANPDVLAPGPLMMTMGLSSLLLASIMLYRCRDIKRLFAYSSIKHMGIMAFAFGLGGPLANFAGLLHMVMHSLTKSGIFFAVGHICQIKGTQKLNAIRGLTTSHPLLGWALVIGVVAIIGLPPFGVFMSEFLIVTSTFAALPWLALPLFLGLILGFGALTQRLQAMAFGPEEGSRGRTSPYALIPFFVHLTLVLMAGLYLPAPLIAWFQNVAKLLN